MAHGRRRVVTLLAFLNFVLLVAGVADQEWLTGGLTIIGESGLQSKAAARALGACAGCVSTAPGSLGDTIRIEFDAGLQKMSQFSTWNYPFSGEAGSRDCVYNLQAWLGNFNAGTTISTAFSYGLNPISYSTFASTQGLLAFAATMQTLIWLVLVAVQYEAPVLGRHKHSLWAVRLASPFVTFFTMVGIIVFSTSSAKTEFCLALDPDGDAIGLPCGFGNGFRVTIAAFVFGFVQIALAWFFMGVDLSARYSFAAGGSSSGGVGSGSSSGLGSSKGGYSYEPASTASFVGSSGGGYQDAEAGGFQSTA